MGVVRVSMVHDNTIEEVDWLTAAGQDHAHGRIRTSRHSKLRTRAADFGLVPANGTIASDMSVA
jgi:hypothetical protein